MRHIATFATVTLLLFGTLSGMAQNTPRFQRPSEDQYVAAALTLAGLACNGSDAGLLAAAGATGPGNPRCPNRLSTTDAQNLRAAYLLLRAHVASPSATAKVTDADLYFSSLRLPGVSTISRGSESSPMAHGGGLGSGASGGVGSGTSSTIDKRSETSSTISKGAAK